MKSRFFVIILSIIFLFCGCNNTGKTETKTKSSESKEKNATIEEIKAIWINYNELNEIINKSADSNALKNNISDVVQKCAKLGLNRIILHVRAFSDAYYMSEIFPINKHLIGKISKDINFDPLKVFCETAHENNLKIDAWLNPYRISYNNDIDKIDNSSFFKEMLSKGNDIAVIKNGIYYNPASEKAQKLIIDGVREILKNYSVDGIHIDDYFYPSADVNFDKASYSDYQKEGGKLGLAQWRRENVSSLVAQVYSVVKSHNEKCIFSISPGGDINKNYTEYFADVERWCSESGYADLIIPQVYFGFENEKMPFEKVVSEWEKIAANGTVKLGFGLACYKYKKADEYAGAGRNEWINSEDIISRQILSVRQQKNYAGFYLYSYSSLFSSKNDEINKIGLQNIESVIY